MITSKKFELGRDIGNSILVEPPKISSEPRWRFVHFEQRAPSGPIIEVEQIISDKLAEVEKAEIFKNLQTVDQSTGFLVQESATCYTTGLTSLISQKIVENMEIDKLFLVDFCCISFIIKVTIVISRVN